MNRIVLSLLTILMMSCVSMESKNSYEGFWYDQDQYFVNRYEFGDDYFVMSFRDKDAGEDEYSHMARFRVSELSEDIILFEFVGAYIPKYNDDYEEAYGEGEYVGTKEYIEWLVDSAGEERSEATAWVEEGFCDYEVKLIHDAEKETLIIDSIDEEPWYLSRSLPDTEQ